MFEPEQNTFFCVLKTALLTDHMFIHHCDIFCIIPENETKSSKCMPILQSSSCHTWNCIYFIANVPSIARVSKQTAPAPK